jgi:transcriptional regulator with XRE-family HTH domain
MVDAAKLVREARLAAGLTQAELARRMGTTQSAVARLEGVASNPRLDTLERALRASGHSLSLASQRPKPSVDETLIARQLRLTPEQRLRAFEASYRDVRKLAGSAVA